MVDCLCACSCFGGHRGADLAGSSGHLACGVPAAAGGGCDASACPAFAGRRAMAGADAACSRVGVCSGIWCDRIGARQAFSTLESDSLGGGHELASMHRAAIHVGPSSSRQASSGLWCVHRGGPGRHFDKPVAWRLWHHGLDLLVARHFVAKSPPSGIRQPHWYGRSSLRGHCGRGSIVARGSLATSQGLARNRTGGKRG